MVFKENKLLFLSIVFCFILSSLALATLQLTTTVNPSTVSSGSNAILKVNLVNEGSTVAGVGFTITPSKTVTFGVVTSSVLANKVGPNFNCQSVSGKVVCSISGTTGTTESGELVSIPITIPEGTSIGLISFPLSGVSATNDLGGSLVIISPANPTTLGIFASAPTCTPACSDNKQCNEAGVCITYCGNSVCDDDETVGICPADCSVNPEVCTNNIDDDGDGLTDCADSACNNQLCNTVSAPGAICTAQKCRTLCGSDNPCPENFECSQESIQLGQGGVNVCMPSSTGQTSDLDEMLGSIKKILLGQEPFVGFNKLQQISTIAAVLKEYFTTTGQ